ncbi:PrsW family intramembrane metalloprotease [Nocardioides insulae]|uniref:PrsW family intramembrane metalloprotease n=1 Tax=Nocardioides insulae TaxID=394734 RepID=UPI0004138B15|nr:PrsW family intramembrane metalloprotease [Nocardioides insulae]
MTTTTQAAELEQGRRDALDATGWGLPFRFWQPRNACLWVFLLIVLFGVHRAVGEVSAQVGYFLPALGLSGGIGILFTVAWLVWFRHLDKFEHEPWSMLATAFVWGGMAAPFAMAIYANTSLNYLYGKLFGRDFANDWAAGLSAPFTEELAKGAGVLLLIGLARYLVVTVADGVILGAFVGLGFQALEDFVYSGQGAAGSFGSDQIGESTHMIATRAASDVISHPLFTALFGAGLIYLVGTRVQPRRIGRGLGLIAAAMLTHGLWDSMVGIGAGNGLLTELLMLGVSALGLTVLWWAFEWATRQAAPYAADVLAPEVADGVVEQAEVNALFGRKARKTFIKATVARGEEGGQRRSSRRERWHRRRRIAAVLDLSADLAHSYGNDSPEVAHSRAEVVRVRQL